MSSADGTVIVTGAASGLGRAVAVAVEREGGTAIGFDLRPIEGIESVEVDLADTEKAEAATRQVIEAHGGLDGVVTAGGMDACGPLDGVPVETWNRVVAVNLLGTAAVVRAALPALVDSHGRVVTVASTLGIRGFPDATAYCASKFGVVGFTQALAAETAGKVGVTLLTPGGMDTAFFDGRDERYKPPPDARLSPPEEVAEAVVFALSRPPGVELRHALFCPSTETSWP
ncbi:MAG TPA: SDR family oxidoreductase [Solirubrobacterales bacterium]|nr:SDR family oxidoreductase [Solirubrobacterales bacterium]